jgi:hypothetical protein
MSSQAEFDRIPALLRNRGIRGTWLLGAGQMSLAVPAEHRVEALRILGEAKRKEGLKLTLLMDATKLETWPAGPGLKPEMKLAAKLDEAGVPVVSGELKITNPREENLTLQASPIARRWPFWSSTQWGIPWPQKCAARRIRPSRP